jgi:hypothetical protein
LIWRSYIIIISLISLVYYRRWSVYIGKLYYRERRGLKKPYIRKGLCIRKKSLPLSILYTVCYILIDLRTLDRRERALYGAPSILPPSRLTATFTACHMLPLYSSSPTMPYSPVCPPELPILSGPSSAVFPICLICRTEPLLVNMLQLERRTGSVSSKTREAQSRQVDGNIYVALSLRRQVDGLLSVLIGRECWSRADVVRAQRRLRGRRERRSTENLKPPFYRVVVCGRTAHTLLTAQPP